jgi:hypothetical protein
LFVLSFRFGRQPQLRPFKRILAAHGYASRGDDFRYTPHPVPMVISARDDGTALFAMKCRDRDSMSRFIEGFEDAFPALPVLTCGRNMVVLHGPKGDVMTAVWQGVLQPLESAETKALFDDIIQREFGTLS